ncbi:acyltransferase family protein [Streptomyces iconiensis]|uniref:Acyltransferase family protein n=1 Tax=Streptomyces iconiensis TaxID=1384038 RepID=A0ABT6ZWG9_9ACTN|nr:acyltransferase family protein [Streptomyces iconiensis]MDJ1133413.1 acyltransferase family protein [Streptomyces iconiensis]
MLSPGYERAPLPPLRETPVETVHDTRAEAEKKPSGKNDRDPFLDNAKYLTIVLVAIGHAWAPFAGNSRTTGALYMLVYAFHMPAFIVISGYLSRSFDGRPRQISRLVTGVLVPYVIFQTAYTLFMRAVDNPDREFYYQKPGFALWFLVALFLWRLTTPMWKNLRWPVSVSLVIAIAASVTPSIGGDLGLMRVVQFLPFFVLGLQLRPEHFRFLQSRPSRRVALPVAACAALLAYWAVPRMSSAWFGHAASVQQMGVPAWKGAVVNLALFGCSLVLTACFLAWVPRRRLWFTALGAGTLYAYLLHVYPIRLARVNEWYDMSWVGHPLGRVTVTILAAVMMTLLCTAPVRRVFRGLMEPKMAWFFRPDPAAAARAREHTPTPDRDPSAQRRDSSAQPRDSSAHR